MRSLDPSLLDLGVLQADHIRRLAPIILGPRGWQHYETQHFYSWGDFKNAINKEFGLSPSQLNTRYYGLRP